MKKLMKVIFSIIKYIMIIILILLAVIVFLQRFSNNNLSFFKYRMFSVVTSSMTPKYNVGDVLLSKEIPFSELKVGDDISYLGDYGQIKGKVITHRIVRIDNVQGEYTFRTKGIANLSEDKLVKENQVYGKIIMKVPIISELNYYISTTNGFFLCVIIPIMIIIGSEVLRFMLERFEKKKENS